MGGNLPAGPNNYGSGGINAALYDQIVGNGLNVPNAAALTTLPAADFAIGSSWCWVTCFGAWFNLQASSLAPTPATVIPAADESGNPLPGVQWLRMDWRNPAWEAVTSWFVNTTLGDDEGLGTASSPLRTISEVARRMAYAQLTTAVTTTVIGNVDPTDTAMFTFYLANSNGSFSLSGTPTVLYSGTVTSTTVAGAAPTTGDNTLTDSAIAGGSFTAAGATATGVMFTRTSSTPCTWFVVKDKGSQTARISVPMSGLVTSQTLNAGDSYNFSQLPTLTMPRFPNATVEGGANANSNITIKNWFLNAPRIGEGCFIFSQCWVSGGKFAGGNFLSQCCLTGNTQFVGSPTNFLETSSSICGGAIGTASIATFLLVFASTYTQLVLPVALTLQNAFIQVSAGYLEQNGPDILAYDATSYVFLIDYNGKFLQKHSGAFGGSGNAKLCNVAHGSWFMHTTNPYWLAGSSTDAVTPILQNGSAGISVATETTGGGTPNAGQNGVFPTS